MIRTCALLALLLTTGLFAADEPKSKGIDGVWVGTLTIKANAELRLVFDIRKDGDKLKGTMDSPDQGARDLPLDDVAFKDGAVTITMKKLAITYTGKLNADGNAIEGTFQQGEIKLPLNLKRGDKPAPPKRPQLPKPPFPYKAEDVTYENAAAGIKLAATLTLPEGKGPFPAVLLITGSGPQDRDETIFEHKPFLVIADYLTRKGIAVLRADDRGVGKSTGKFAGATTLDFLGDALSGVAYLKTRPEIDAKRIGLIGHSEGGLIAPMAAVKSKDVAFIVMLAGPGLPGNEILAMQAELALKGAGTAQREVDWMMALHKKMIAVVLKEKDDRKAREAIKEVIAADLKAMSPEDRKAFVAAVKKLLPIEKGKDDEAAIQAALEQSAEAVLTPWFRYFLSYDPRPTLAKVTCPVLALNGAKDFQVPPKENLAALAAAFKEGGNKNVTLKEMPGLNHLFQTCKTGMADEYIRIEETFAPAALEVMAAWIAERR